MANHTVYPYGTDGELPSSIGLVNDLTTGGVDKALTAEMGKTLNQNINNVLLDVVEDGFYVIDGARNIGFMVDSNGAHSANLVEY